MSSGEQGTGTPGKNGGRGLVTAVLVGLLCSLAICIVTPYVNFVLHVGFIADAQLPAVVIFLVCVLTLVVNPFLRRFVPRFSLSRLQLGIILGMMLVASVPASGGLHRFFISLLAHAPWYANQEPLWEELLKEADLPPSLFPEKLEYQAEIPAVEYFMNALPRGESIPWGNWVPPLLSWGPFLFFSFLMMGGMGLLVYQQWRKNERLPFPLLNVGMSMIEDSDDGHAYGPLYRKRSFWAALILVFVLYLLKGLNQYNPGGVPAVPLQFDIHQLFTSSPFTFLPYYIWQNQIYFSFIALAFFMPNRISLSIWFWQVVYALYQMIGTAYYPPFHSQSVSHHRGGAMVAIMIVVLWLGRQYWARIGRLLVSRGGSEEDRRDRRHGWMFVVGCAGMAAWFMWAGVEWYWSLAMVGMSFMLALVTTRMVAETGLLQIWLYEVQLIDLTNLVPAAWYSPSALFFVGLVGVIFGNGGRVCAPAMFAHATGLTEKGMTPKRQGRFALILLAVLCLSVVVGAVFHLHTHYNWESSLDGVWRPLTPWGGAQITHSLNLLRQRDSLFDESGERLEGRSLSLGQYAHNGYLHFGIGLGLAGVLEWLCLTVPQWPIHPVGMLIVMQWHANLIWFNVLLGWLAKVILVRYGGSRLYRAAVPFFMGFIIGELLSGVFWLFVSLGVTLTGREFQVVNILPY